MAAQPGCIVDVEFGPEPGAAGVGEYVPRRLQIAGRVADAQRAGVDDRATTGRRRTQVARQQIAVQPDIVAVPGWCTQRLGPRSERGGGVDPVAELSDRATHPVVGFDVRSTSAPQRTGRCTGGVEPPQGDHELGEIDGGLRQIVDGTVRVRAGQPLVHRPRERITVRRMSHRELHRHRERQVRCEPRQPLRLLLGLAGGPTDAREAGDETLAQSVDVVVGPVRGNRADRQIDPSRELIREQATHQCDVGVDLVGVHPGCGHGAILGGPRRAGQSS